MAANPATNMITINPDLKRERENVSFDPLLLTYSLDGGIAKTRRRRYIENLAISDRDYDGPNFDFMSRESRFDEGLRKEMLLAKKIKQLGLKDDEASLYTFSVLRDGDTGLSLHRLAFVPVMRTQTTEEQKKAWLPLIEANKMIGCYAQTELGHGSHVRGLETTAVYDAKTQEFVINTPTLSATKWWPGNLGKSSNHALVLAQLYTQGEHRGLYPFLVPIRSLQDHQPLPGISVGDIGPKFGGDMNDNGYLRMDNVRIPRMNMLMRHAQVQPDGTFIKPKNEKLTYSGMLAIRAVLPASAARSLAAAVTVATRYSCVRRQSELRPGSREPQIIDYVTQQHKLFPLIATAYAMWFTAQKLRRFHDTVIAEINNGNFSRLIELHGSCAVLKAWTTYTSSCSIEQCRLSCGGHGYSQASGLPKLWTSSGVVGAVTAEGEFTVLLLQGARLFENTFLPKLHGSLATLKAYCTAENAKSCEICRLACGGHGYSHGSGLPKYFTWSVGGVTAEGEYTVMMLQSARYLMKCAANSVQGKKLDDSVAYLGRTDFGQFSYKGDQDIDSLFLAIQYRAAFLTRLAATKMQKLMASGQDMSDAWNNSSVSLVKAAQAHAEVLLMSGIVDRVKSGEDPAVIVKTLTLLACVYGIHIITKEGGDFIQDGFMSSSQLDFLQEKQYQLYEVMRPDAIAYVDAFDNRDEQLGGVLGRYDGNVYEELFKWAQQSQLNETEVHSSYHKYLKPLFAAKI